MRRRTEFGGRRERVSDGRIAGSLSRASLRTMNASGSSSASKASRRCGNEVISRWNLSSRCRSLNAVRRLVTCIGDECRSISNSPGSGEPLQINANRVSRPPMRPPRDPPTRALIPQQDLAWREQRHRTVGWVGCHRRSGGPRLTRGKDRTAPVRTGCESLPLLLLVFVPARTTRPRILTDVQHSE